MRRFLGILLLLLCVGSAQAGTPWLIKPGTGVGAWTLGMDAAVPDKMLPAPRGIPLANNINAFVYAQVGLTLQVDKKTNRVVEFAINQPHATIQGQAVDFLADKGVTVGSTIPQMQSVFGRNCQSKNIPVAAGQPPEVYYAYQSLGIGFHSKGNLITEISVWAKH